MITAPCIIHSGAVFRSGYGFDRTANPERDYKLLGATRVKATRKELDEALAAGYEPIRLASIGEFIIVFDRVQAKP
jgi:hypothetical protein